MRTSSAMTIAAVVAASSLAYAQNTPDRPNQPPTTPRPSQPEARPGQQPQQPGRTITQDKNRPEDLKKIQLERASVIMGTNVKNAAGENLGEIHDLALDPQNDRVAFVVLSFGGMLNVGDKLFAVPFESFEFNRLNKVAVLNVEKERLQNAPNFDKTKWPNLSDEKWGQEVYKFYGHQPYWTTSGTTDAPAKTTAVGARTILKGSDVVGMDAHNTADEDLGEIEDVVIELNRGHIAYAVLAAGGVLGVGEKLHAMPWQNINFRTGENVIGMDKQLAIVEVDKDRLKDAPGFDKDKWPDMADARWMREVNTFYGTEPNWLYGYDGATGAPSTPGQAGGWDKPDYYNKYNAADVKTITGKITDVQHVSPMTGMGQGVVLTLQETDGKTCKVHLGPDAYISRQNVTFNSGQQVTLQGSKVTLNGQEVFMAKDIQVNGKTIRLRDDSGRPLWLSTTGNPGDRPTTGRPTMPDDDE